jgi:NAD+ synthetase
LPWDTAPIGDLYKTRVYELARFINEKWGSPIPERTITKAPSAELRPNQTDQDTLPPYEVLDEILVDYLEKGRPIAELVSRYETGAKKYYGTIIDILRKVEMNEYKRRQAAPVLRVTSKAFGVGRRVPIAKTWEPS